MNVKNIIKIYFYFLVLVLSMAGLSYNSSFKSFYLEGVDTMLAFSKDLKSISNMRVNMADVSGFNNRDSLALSNKAVLSDNIIFNNKNIFSYAKNAEENVYLMEFSIKSMSEAYLKDIRFSVEGLKEGQSIDLFLEKDNEFIYSKPVAEKYEFSFINKVDLKNGVSFKVRANLPDNLEVNQRIRLLIKEESDIEIEENNKTTSPKINYPIYSNYLSIVGEKVVK